MRFMILLMLLSSYAFASDKDYCAREALRQAEKYAEIVNTSSLLQGGKIDLIVDQGSLRQFNRNEYGVRLSSDHGGYDSFYARELVLTGRPSMLSCRVSGLRIYKLRLITPGTTEWSQLLFASDKAI